MINTFNIPFTSIWWKFPSYPVYLLRFFRNLFDFYLPNPRKLGNVYFISRFDPIQETVDLAVSKYFIWNPLCCHGSPHQATR